MADEADTGGDQLDVPPLRIAAVGETASAIFHLEAAAIRDGLEAVVLARSTVSADATVPVPGCDICCVDELIERSDIDVVFVSGAIDSRIEIAEAILQHGKHIVVDASADMTRSHVQRLIQASSDSNQYCAVWRPRNADLDFLRAVQVVASAGAGEIRAIRLMQHDMAAALLPVSISNTSRERIEPSTLRDLAGHRIAQALALIGSPVVSVSAVSSRESVSFGMGESIPEVVPDGDTAMHIMLSCENGGSVMLDLGLSCVAPVNTGWIVQGEQGGYSSERQYITVEDGEIYDVAVEVDPIDLYQQLGETIRSWNEASTREECIRRLHREMDVADILQQIH